MQKSFLPTQQIISASRRTDIAAFFMPWLMNRLDAGFVRYPNPYSGQAHTVSLRPEDVHSIVFWSKNFAPLLPHLDEIQRRGFFSYYHFTITGLPRSLEAHTPQWQQSVRVFRELVERTSPRHVQWRFDPILYTKELDAAYYHRRFEEIAAALSGATQRCYFSFAQFYGKVIRQFNQAGLAVIDPSLEQKRELALELAETGAKYGIQLYACCQDDLLSEQVHKAHCIDADLLGELFPDRPFLAAARPTREQCGCAASRDIGIYDTCPHGCIYCYANQNHLLALERFRQHDPDGEMLYKSSSQTE